MFLLRQAKELLQRSEHESHPILWCGILLALILIAGCQRSAGSGLGGRDVSFDLSPNGSHICFVGAGEGRRDLYLLNLEDKRVTRLTQSPLYEQKPLFSPDGKYIVYSASEKPNDASAPWHLYVFEIDTKQVKRLTEGYHADSPCFFTPDGKHLVFSRAVRNRPYSMGGRVWDTSTVYVSPFRGSDAGLGEPKPVPLRFCMGRPSTDGAFVVEGSTLTAPSSEPLVEINISAWMETEPEPATATPLTRALQIRFGTEIYDPTWTPDGHLLTFITAESDYRYEVWTIRRDGKALKKLTNLGSYIECLRVDAKWAYFLKLEKNGSQMRKGIWRVPFFGGKPEQVADYTLFDDPLSYKP